MAFNNSYTAVTGATYTAANYNTSTRDNLNAIWVYTTAGDMVFAASATALTRLPIGTNGQVLTVVTGAPAWANAAGAQFPIGWILESAVNTNPATFLGYGTWEAYGAGRVTVGLDSGQTEFDTAGETGGEKTHVLTAAELASHYHTMDVCSDFVHVATGTGAWTPGVTPRNTGTAGSDSAHNNLQPYIVVYRWKRTA